MAYLKRVTIGKRIYLYIIKSVRRGDRVEKKVLEYLGAEPGADRLRKALTYWGVKEKPGRGKGRKGR